MKSIKLGVLNLGRDKPNSMNAIGGILAYASKAD